MASSSTSTSAISAGPSPMIAKIGGSPSTTWAVNPTTSTRKASAARRSPTSSDGRELSNVLIGVDGRDGRLPRIALERHLMTPSRQRHVRFLAVDLARSGEVTAHSHRTHQLLRVERGAVAFSHDLATWVVPTGGAVWIPAGLVHRFDALEETTAWGLYVRPLRSERLAGPGPVEMSPLLHALMETLSHPVPDAARRSRLERVVRDELGDLRPRQFVVAVPSEPAARQVALTLIADPA